MKSKNTEPPSQEQAYQYSLRLLTGRDYTASKIKGKLSALGFSEQNIEEAVQRLIGEGWLDDRRYAGRFAESALSSGRYYGRRLSHEMRRRGMSAQLVDEVIKQASEDYNEVDELRSLIARRYPGFVYSVASDKEKRRIISWFQRRGFGISSVIKALQSPPLD